MKLLKPEAAIQRCSLEKTFQKICSKFTGEHAYGSCFVTLLKSHFGMGVPL